MMNYEGLYKRVAPQTMAACGSTLTGSPSGPDRQMRISKVGYHKVQQRDFAPGHDWEDWFAAEREVTESQ